MKASKEQTHNKAMFYDKEELNPCTKYLRRLCEEKGCQLVELRDGSFRKVEWIEKGKGGACYDMFRDTKEDSCLSWYADGSCFTSQDWDIVRIPLQ